MDDLTFRELIGLFFILFGLFFSVMGILGLLRFPDVYSRSHAAGKVSVLGVMGLLIASGILLPETVLKVTVLGIFLILTQPVASHAIASSAYRAGVRMKNGQRDDLAASRAAESAAEEATPETRA